MTADQDAVEAAGAKLRQRVAAGDPPGVLSVVRGLDTRQRRALLKVVDAMPEEARYENGAPYAARLVARLACSPSAGAGLEKQLRRDAWFVRDHYDAVLAALVEFHPGALPGLLTRLAENNEHTWNRTLFPLTDLIRVELKAPYPQTLHYVFGLLHSPYVLGILFPKEPAGPAASERLRSDPELHEFLPRVLDVPGLALPDFWGEMFASLCADGALERQHILDRAVAGMLRGGERWHVVWFASLHDALKPTVDEVGGRLSSYTALVVDGEAPAALAAQAALRVLDDAGGLPLDDFWEMSAGTLCRAERQLVSAQVRWVRAVERRSPDSVDDAACTVAVALGHDATAIAERALALLEKWWPRMSAAARTDVGGHLDDLAPSLHARLATLTGTTVVVAATAERRVDSGESTRLPPPIQSLDELREAAAHTAGTQEVYSLERVTDGVLALAGSREKVWRTLRAHSDHHANAYGDLLADFLPRALSPEGIGAMGQGTVVRTYDDDDDMRALDRLTVNDRLEEIRLDVVTEHPRRLLSLATHRPGRLDPDTFVSRVRAALQRGEPLRPLDLEQALRRLPPTCLSGLAAELSPLLPERARAQVADWLVMRSHVPRAELYRMAQVESEAELAERTKTGKAKRALILTRFSGGPVLTGPLGPLTWGQDEIRQSARLPGGGVYWDPRIWLATDPWNRDYAAAMAATQIAVGTDHDDQPNFQHGDDCRDFRTFLGELAHGGGPTGAATGLLLARFAVSQDGIDQLIAADTAVALFRAGELDTASWGEALELIVEYEHFPVRRIAHTLTAVAAAGEWECVWQTCRSMLPQLLLVAAHDTALLVAIAADAAAATGARGEVGELAEVADRRGKKRLFVEARRLRDILASQPSGPPENESAPPDHR